MRRNGVVRGSGPLSMWMMGFSGQFAKDTINEDKSNFQPAQRSIWLGFVIDKVGFTFSVATGKRDELHTLNECALYSSQSISSRQIAKGAGSIISMGPGIGSLTRLLMRKMYGFIDQSHTRDG